ncbi:hypothetical protein BH09VER1_BH09VER1_48330 [soil metagenome]
MISRYNLQQIALGLACALGGLLGYVATYLFFRYVPVFIAYQFRQPLAPWIPIASEVLGLLAVTFSGYRVWHKRGGFHSYFDSGLLQNIGYSVPGFLAFGDRANQVSGIAYMLGQLFLAGPLMVLRSLQHFRNRIASEPGLEERLAEVLTALRQLKQWEDLRHHPQEQREILLLAQMRQIDFSALRGEPRFRAFSP